MINSVLHSNHLLRRTVTVLLLSIFTLGITPKKTLHNLLANHTDNISKTSDAKNDQISKGGINCKCNDLVAESNFIVSGSINIPVLPEFHSGFISSYSSFHSLPRLLFNLRGPPSKA